MQIVTVGIKHFWNMLLVLLENTFMLYIHGSKKNSFYIIYHIRMDNLFYAIKKMHFLSSLIPTAVIKSIVQVLHLLCTKLIYMWKLIWYRSQHTYIKS